MSPSPKLEPIRVFLGAYAHSISKDEPLQIVSNGVIGISGGKIIFVDVEDNLEALKEDHSFTSDNIFILGQCEFLMCGFVDTHIHAPQYPNAGLGLDLPLLEWLQKYTFPMETRFQDSSFARSCYKKVVERTLRNGTTTASYYATLHQSSAEILADVVEAMGQRALIGKVAMDSCSPNDYIETTEESLKSTEEFVVKTLERKSKRVRPTITPRFALNCSETLMKGLANIAREYDVNIQTHLCESKAEIKRVLEVFPQYKSYAEVYEEMGLMTEKSIMAHCVYLEKDEIDILVRNSTSVSHCPTSNFCILSGLCPVRKLMDSGISVGLGTDISGGYSPSILEAMRHALITSKILTMQDPTYKPLSFKDVLYMATLGGAQALSMEKEIGNFEVGKKFDALHIDLAAVGSPIHLFPGEDRSQLIEKFVMLGDDRNIVRVFVDGRQIKFQD